MDDFSVSVPGSIDTLGYSVYKSSVILRKLLSVLGMAARTIIFCTRVGK